MKPIRPNHLLAPRGRPVLMTEVTIRRAAGLPRFQGRSRTHKRLPGEGKPEEGSVDKQYEQYCLTDPVFYDSPQQREARDLFPISTRPLPDGWHRARRGDWLVNTPPGPPPPAQGWKIHVSTCLDNS